MDKEKEQKGNQINIELSPEVAEGTYSNLAIIAHSSSEFVIDFVRIMPNTPKANVKSRIILTPEHAKRLLQALQENVSKFESQFGPIKKANSNFMPPIVGFGGGEA
jgi:predicted transcriptional regulator